METEVYRQQIRKEQEEAYRKSEREDLRKAQAKEDEQILAKLNEEKQEDRRARLLGPYLKKKESKEEEPEPMVVDEPKPMIALYDYVMSWSTDEVVKWLIGIDLEELASKFRENEIDGKALWAIERADLVDDLRITSFLKRKKLWEALEMLRFSVEQQDWTVVVQIMKVDLGEIASSVNNQGELLAVDAQMKEVLAVEASLKDAAEASKISTIEYGNLKEVKSNELAAKGFDSKFTELSNTEINDLELARRLGGVPVGNPRKEFEDKYANVLSKNGDEVMIPEGKREVTVGRPEPPKASQPSSELLELIRGECGACTDERMCLELPCGTLYCKGCLKHLLLSATTDKTLMPVQCCKIDVDPHLARYILPEKDCEKFLAMYQEATSTNKMYCPNNRCSQFLDLDLVEAEQFDCPSCKTSICRPCKSSHPNQSCEAFQALPIELRDPDAHTTVQLANEMNWRKCSQCNRYVELSTGCYHITCLCRHQFCYVCGETWKKCQCPQWDEDHLMEVARERVPNNGGQRDDLMNRLRGRHCTHTEHWNKIYRSGGNCQNCGFYTAMYHFRCNNCFIRVCFVCRQHRTF